MSEKEVLAEKYYGWKKLFVRIRFWDAPFTQVERLIPKKGLIVDIGCGEGIFTNFLGMKSASRKLLGIEINKERLKDADVGVLNVSFQWGDAIRTNYPSADAIVLFHLLHHLPSYVEQELVLKKCLKSLKNDGKLVIVEIDKKWWSVRYWLTWFTDHFLVPWLFEKRFHTKIYFRKRNEWVKLLKRFGLSCKIISADQGKPFSHVILLCLKK